MIEILNKEGFLVTIDIEKAINSVNHHFIIAILEKIGFGTEFIEWIKLLLNSQESCVINGRKTSKYFKVERGTRQGDPISDYLFIIVLEAVFRIIKKHQILKVLKFFRRNLFTLLTQMILLFLLKILNLL